MRLAAIRVRGPIRVRGEIAQALIHLNLIKKNSCVIIEDKPSVLGQLKKAQGFITWGSVTDDTIKAMEKRKKGKVYALCPPKKGFGRKGIKIPFKQGGALGDRSEKINDLIMRML